MTRRKKRRKITKAQAQKIHFKKRMLERFNLRINRHDIKDIVECIHQGTNVVSTKKLTNRVFVYRMVYCGHQINIYFDRVRQVPITAKTPDMDDVSYSGITSKKDLYYDAHMV